MSTYRLFIAIEIPAHLQTALVELQNSLKQEVSETVFRWVRPEHIHLTLVFLGEVPTDQVPALTEAIQVAGQEHGPFSLAAHGLGGFPNLVRPRVLWVGLNDSTGALHKLHKTLGLVLAPLGFPAEARPYTPHLTLAYAHRRAAAREVKRAGDRLGQLQLHEIDHFEVASISLMRSQLKPSGPIYNHMAEAPLTGPTLEA